jgi:hypothetical protein
MNLCILGQTFCDAFNFVFLKVPYTPFFTRSLFRLQTLVMKSEVVSRYSDEAVCNFSVTWGIDMFFFFNS